MSDKNGLPAMLPKPANEMAKQTIVRLELILRMLPPGIQQAAFCVAVVNEINRLEECVPASVIGTVYNCATVGLIPGSASGHAYFIPYKDKGGGGKKRAQLVVGYRGFIELGMASDFLRDLHTDVVLTDEKWRYWKDESGPRLEHEVPLERPSANRTNVAGAYCIYHSRDGGKGITVLSRKQLNAVDSNAHVWKSAYDEMCKKSAIRRSSKEWRLSYRLARAVQLDEQAECGEEQEVDVTLDTESPKSFSLKDIAETPTEA